ncbi:hypothetical protein TVAG_193200 [Trichomonas vaginalis G3]|uniref:GYF domain-containing protein n=1 Tax=Trichomonas vaginalis (strain ATCC PRA-98 / G3) TaxID=412133 RepID=A2DH34_TRIV3|nr:GYF domain family [Trichomonas vaginalis G3]EAY20344.1 hypothetical protein TVAG_193200 [Trichomonas vaginalis G3]KAI5530665.1 GYF domain family [Trichomonas vaginalis G3]|eukprot:XP_001581330.1 hypothetical protein [Trichomonas vaginalis G3]
MSRFAVLKSSGSEDDEADNPLQMLTPKYSIQKILSSFKPASILPAPTELMAYENVYMKEVQSLECNTFKPPTSEINVPSSVINGKITPRTAQTTQIKRQIRASPKGKKLDATKPFSEEELATLWFYKDPTGQVLGPYLPQQMRTWLDKKYISLSLPVCQGTANGPFKPISSLFSDQNSAFQERKYNQTQVEIQKPAYIEPRRQEKKLSTLFSFSIDEKEDDLLECWEKTDSLNFK